MLRGMTNTTATQSDPRTLLDGALALAGEVIAAVRPDQLGDPTPCTEFDVRALLDHLVGVPGRVAATGRGERDFAWPEVPEGGWTAAWEAGVDELRSVWGDDSLLGRQVTLPWGLELPGAAVVALFTSEVTVHTWDLATATGQSPAWDDAVVATALAAMRQALPPGARPGPELPFADEVPAADDAPLIECLAAYTGRRRG
jgi:uncharacterized protein (TIGR03086 family)